MNLNKKLKNCKFDMVSDVFFKKPKHVKGEHIMQYDQKLNK